METRQHNIKDEDDADLTIIKRVNSLKSDLTLLKFANTQERTSTFLLN